MIDDPYKVLGVSSGASQEEIKQAYRRKAKECHPDLHPDDPNANEKMNQVNEAYDMLMHPEKYQARQAQQQARQNPYGNQGNPYGQQSNPYGQQGNPYSQRGYGGWQSSGDWFDFEDLFGFGQRQSAPIQPPQEMPGDSEPIRFVVRSINARQYAAALQRLSTIPSTGRNARWYYLSGLANQGAGNSIQAMEQMQRAVQLEPNNSQYHQLLQQYRQAGQTYQQNARGFDMGAMDPSRLCMGLCLANFLCRFIRCC